MGYILRISHTCMDKVIDNPANPGLRVSLFKTANNATPNTINDETNCAQNDNHLQLTICNMSHYELTL